MKVALLVWLLSSLIVPGLATLPYQLKPHNNEAAIQSALKAQIRGPAVKSDETCEICIQFSVNAINILLNLVLDGAVIKGCGTLCGALADKTNKITGEVCDVLCGLVGIHEFIKIIEEADLDPIYYCELLDQCKVNDYGDANITNATTIPKSGPQGQFQIPVEYASKNGTGTGQIGITVHAVDGLIIEDVELNYAQDPGTYNVEWNLHAIPDPDCNPVPGPCEYWIPGIYNVTVVICEGMCGSDHPHASIYDEVHFHFEITGKSEEVD